MKKIKIIACISGLILLLVGCGSYKGELVAVKSDTSNVYHRDNCKLIKDVKYENLILFNDLEQTASMGYRPCKTCSPPNNMEVAKELYESQTKEFNELKPKFEKHKEYLDNLHAKGKLNTVLKEEDKHGLLRRLEISQSYKIDTEFMTVEECERYLYLLNSLETLKSYIEK